MNPEREATLIQLTEALLRQPRASMEQLAQAVGISRATLHRLVSSREELIQELTELAFCRCTATISSIKLEQGPAEDVVRQLVASLMPLTSLFLFLRRSTGCSDEVLEHRWEPHRQQLIALFQRGQEEGVFRVDLPAQWLVEAMGGLLYAAAESAHNDRLARADMTRVVCAVLLDGAHRRPLATSSSSS